MESNRWQTILFYETDDVHQGNVRDKYSVILQFMFSKTVNYMQNLYK